MHGFSHASIRTLSDRMDALAKESVDRLFALGGECDFYNEIAIYYPLRVLMTILGLPPEDEQRLLKITQAYFGGGDPEMQKGDDLIDATMAYVEYFKDVAKERRQNPKDDVATVIATSEIDGRPIEDFEAYSYYMALASAGHDTTSATIAGGLLALIENPDAMARLQRDPEIIPDAAEEMVRWVSPVKHFFRTAAVDYEIRGKKIKAGDSLFISFPSGNRDEEAFDRPFEFIPDRSPNRHLGFGFGIHACIGRHLAKAEIVAFFRELLKRIDTSSSRASRPGRRPHSSAGLSGCRYQRAIGVVEQRGVGKTPLLFVLLRTGKSIRMQFAAQLMELVFEHAKIEVQLRHQSKHGEIIASRRRLNLAAVRTEKRHIVVRNGARPARDRYCWNRELST